jgi:hypothetical protein
MATKNSFEITESGFPLGAEGSPIPLYQDLIGNPETGVWCQADEEKYHDYLLNQMWQVLRISNGQILPKNWFYTSEV